MIAVARLFSLLTTVCIFAGMSASAQTPTAQRKKAAPKRAPLFVGTGTVSWLPKAASLPSAGDIEKVAEKLSSRLRSVDPLGVSTFPREDDQRMLDEDPARPTARITLNQALQTLKIIGINLEGHEFLIGGRSVGEGDVMELAYKNENFMAQVVEVGATQILFRDLRRNESGVLTHKIMPQLQLEPLRNVTSRVESKMSKMEKLTTQTR